MASADVERLRCRQMQSWWLREAGTRRFDRRELWPSFARDSTTAVFKALNTVSALKQRQRCLKLSNPRKKTQNKTGFAGIGQPAETPSVDAKEITQTLGAPRRPVAGAFVRHAPARHLVLAGRIKHLVVLRDARPLLLLLVRRLFFFVALGHRI